MPSTIWKMDMTAFLNTSVDFPSINVSIKRKDLIQQISQTGTSRSVITLCFNRKSFHKIRPTGKKLEILIQKNQISKVSVILYKKGGQAL